MVKTKKILFLIQAALALAAIPAMAEDDKSAKPAAGENDGAEKVEVDQIKEKYWARGDESELGVVQNRLYSKAGRFELGLGGGFMFSDPFLDTKTGGGHVGYHFSETWSAHLMGFKSFVSASGAKEIFTQKTGGRVNDNPQRYYVGAEVNASLLYGKLSLLGKKIIYYDFYFLTGAGVMATDNGKYPTPHVGLGQRFYLSQDVALRFDYRLMAYREDIIEKEITSKLGYNYGKRTNFANSISIGFDFLFGGGSSK